MKHNKGTWVTLTGTKSAGALDWQGMINDLQLKGSEFIPKKGSRVQIEHVFRNEYCILLNKHDYYFTDKDVTIEPTRLDILNEQLGGK